MPDSERWRLVRGQRDVQVWPFGSAAEAADFALDHGLLDWRPDRVDEPDEGHHQICGRCRETWPCEHVRLDRQAQRILSAAANTCRRCRKPIGWYKIAVPGGGDLGEDAVYHGKQGACRNLAVRELQRLGHADLLTKLLRDEATRAEWLTQARERKRRQTAHSTAHGGQNGE